VRVDGSWKLSSSGLVKLVDSLDGVQVDTRIGIGPKGEVEASGGPRDVLRGAAAADFAMHPPKGSAEALKLARFHAVIDGVILALPDDQRAQRAAVAGLGTEIESSLPDDQFARFLGDLHRHAKAGHVDDQILPVVRSREPRPGGYDLDAARFEQLLKGPLAHVRRPVKVLVQGDGESAKTADAVRSRLEQAQLDYVAGASTTSGGPAVEKKTTVLATGDSPSDLNRAREVAAALGVPASSIVTQEIIDAAYDVLVQLGADLEALLRGAGLTPTATPA
jgi:hypothetical protein